MTRLILVFCLLSTPLWSAEGFDRNEFLLGLWVANQVEKTHKVLPNHKDSARVVEIATRIVEHAGRKDLYSVAIIKAPVANAFALPGGFFFITDTLLKLNLTDDELAFLIGHEIAHVQNRHFERIQKERAKTSFANALATIGSTLLASRLKDNDDIDRLRRQGALSQRQGPPPIQKPNSVSLPPHLAPVLMSNLFGTLYLLHSQRDFEYEADLSGAKLAVAAGYDLEKGTGMLRKLFYSNYRSSEHVEWTTHPLTQSRIQALRARGKDFTKGEPLKSEILAQRQKKWAERLLDVYELLPLWPKAKGLEKMDIKEARGLLLNRARQLSSDPELKKRALRMEVLHDLFPKVQASSFLVADHGLFDLKVQELIKVGGHLDEEFINSSAQRSKKSLEMHMKELEKSSPGYLQLEYLIRNFPNHPNAENWKWQHWTKEPKVEKMIEASHELLEGDRAKEARKHLLSALKRLKKDPWAYVKISQILDLEINPEALESNLKACESLERLLQFQHAFPDHQWVDRVNERRSERLQHHYRAGRLAMTSRQPRKAVEHFREILLYDPSGQLEEEARELVYRLNVLGAP